METVQALTFLINLMVFHCCRYEAAGTSLPFLTCFEVAVTHDLPDLFQGGPPGPKFHHAESHGHAEGGEDDVLLSLGGPQLVVQLD